METPPTQNYSKTSKVITIGTFDGVHLGHQKILKSVIEKARATKLSAAVLTLFPHPRMVLQNNDNIKLLNTIDERISILKSIGINEVIVKEFTKEFANLSAEAYVKHILVEELSAKTIIIGYDHHFGKNRSANIDDLRVFSESYNFEVEEINALELNTIKISSTKIRNALYAGNISTANTYLGYNYSISGNVVVGKKIGRTLGYRTANIAIEESYKLIPKDGVYVVKSKIDNLTLYGMMNVGKNPTFKAQKHSIEVHFFNFNGDLYNKTIRVEFLKRLRDEQPFENEQHLKAQLHKDKTAALHFLENN